MLVLVVVSCCGEVANGLGKRKILTQQAGRCLEFVIKQRQQKKNKNRKKRKQKEKTQT